MIKLCDVYKHYLIGNRVVNAINGINLEINKNELVLITGESGSGKSTLLNILSNLDNITSGTYLYDGNDIDLLSQEEIDEISRKDFGIISQEYNLFEEESVFKNIEYASVLIEPDEEKREKQIDNVLNELSISSLRNKKVKNLSGGEKQRVAIARALVKNPKIIFADEITSNLDEKNCKVIVEILKKISKNTTVIVVTHDEKLFAKYADKVVVLSDGKIIKDKQISNNKAEENQEKELTFNYKKSNLFGLFKNFSYLVFLFVFSFISLFAPLVIFDATTSNTNSAPNGFYSSYFAVSSENRNVIIKNDKSSFNRSDIEYFSNLPGFQSIFFQDFLLDTNINFKSTFKDFESKSNVFIRPISDIKDVKSGTLPSNDFEVVTNNLFRYGSEEKSFLSLNNTDYYEVKEVGICNNNAREEYKYDANVYYISEKLIKVLYADYAREFNRHVIYTDDIEIQSTNILLSDSVEKGSVVTTNSKFQNQIVNLDIDSSYYINKMSSLRVIVDDDRKIIDKDNKFEDVFVFNREEYIETVNDNYTQISVFSSNRIKSNDKYNVFYPAVNKVMTSVETILFSILYTILFIVIIVVVSIVSLLIINKISNNEFNNYKIFRNIGYSNKQNIIRLIIRNTIPIILSTILNIILFSLFKTLSNYAKITGNELLSSIFIGALSFPQIFIIPLLFMAIYIFILLNNQLNKYRTKVINRNLNDD